MSTTVVLLANRKESEPGADIDLSHFAPYLLSRLNTHFQNLLLEVLRPLGLLVAEWRTLICLARNEKANINDIIRFTSLPQATVSRSVKRLRDRGLLVKTGAGDDKRASLVRISRAGKQLLQESLQQVNPAVEAELTRLLAGKSDSFLKTLRGAVRKSGLEIMHDL